MRVSPGSGKSARYTLNLESLMTGAFCKSGPKGVLCVSDQFSSNIRMHLRSPGSHREFFRRSDTPEPDKFSSDSRNRARCRHVSERHEIGGIRLENGPIPAGA